MYFRFGAALFLVVSISLLGIAIEKQNLSLRRELSRQHYRMDVLKDRHVRLRLRSQQLSAVELLFAAIEDEESGLVPAESPRDLVPRPIAPQADPPANASTQNSSATIRDNGSDRPRRRLPDLFWRTPVRDPRLEGSGR